MKSVLFTLTIFLAIAGKKCNPSKDALPACLQNKIEEFNKDTTGTSPLTIYEYLYNGRRVFLFNYDCCDHFNTLMDENCNYICAPSGGLTGKGDQKCADFNETAARVRLVWGKEEEK